MNLQFSWATFLVPSRRRSKTPYYWTDARQRGIHLWITRNGLVKRQAD